jgi:tripartite-type tricarboxylate transporter receptor subunit TctC
MADRAERRGHVLPKPVLRLRAIRVIRASAVALVGLALSAVQAVSEPSYPSRPVRIIVPSEAGGGTDISARALADRLAQSTGQQFYIENRPGAAGMLGIEIAARAPNDGYTLLIAASTITIVPSTNSNVKYDILRDFAPISQLINSPSVLLVNPALPIKSVKDFLATAKAKPGELSYASAGVGSQPHMAMELLGLMADISIQHIPYKGVAPAMTDVIGGRVASMMGNLISAKSQIDAGHLRGLAVSSLKRSAVLPSLPTVSEAGVAGYEAIQWFGLFAPAGTPAPILARLQSETVEALKSPEIQQRLAADGTEAVGNTSAEFTAQIKSELEKWSKVARAANTKAQ